VNTTRASLRANALEPPSALNVIIEVSWALSLGLHPLREARRAQQEDSVTGGFLKSGPASASKLAMRKTSVAPSVHDELGGVDSLSSGVERAFPGEAAPRLAVALSARAFVRSVKSNSTIRPDTNNYRCCNTEPDLEGKAVQR
jgi:hypothetical protein